MNGRRDWYTSASWDDAARALFEMKIRRSRQPWCKWQYFRGKANALFLAGDPNRLAAAIVLLRRALTEVPGIEPTWSCVTYHRLGQFAEAAGDVAAAERYYRRAIAACPPDERHLISRVSPEEDLTRLLNQFNTDPSRGDTGRSTVHVRPRAAGGGGP